MSALLGCACCRPRRAKGSAGHGDGEETAAERSHVHAVEEPQSESQAVGGGAGPGAGDSTGKGQGKGAPVTESREVASPHVQKQLAPKTLAAATTTPPESFITNIVASPQSWTINTASATWQSIIDDPTLGLKVVTGTGKTLEVSSKLFSGTAVSGISFSNSANVNIWGDNNPVTSDTADSTTTTTVVGGVLGLETPSAGSPLASSVKFSDVQTQFGITSANSTALLQDFVSAVDSNGQLGMQLVPSSSTVKNALWAVPGAKYVTAISLVFEFTETGITSQIESFINKQFGLKLSLANVSPQVIFTNAVTFTPASSGSSSLTPSAAYQMQLQLHISSFDVSAVFSPDGMSIVLTDNGSASSGSIFTRLSNEVIGSGASASSNGLSSTSLPDPSKSDSFDSFAKGLTLLYVQIGMSGQSGSSTTAPSPSNIFFLVGLVIEFTVGSGKGTCLITFDSRTTTFDGQLLFASDKPPADANKQFSLSPWTELPTAQTASLPASVDISSLFGSGAGKTPSGVPTTIKQAQVTYARQGTAGGYKFTLVANAVSGSGSTTTPPATAAPSGFDWTSTQINLTITNDGSTTSVDVKITATFALGSSGNDTMTVTLEYSSGKYWLLNATASNVSLGDLVKFFDPGAQNAAKSLSSIVLQSLKVIYTYSSTGDASSFLISATMVLGGTLELDMDYQYLSPSTSIDSGSNGQTAASIAWGNNPPADVTVLKPGATSQWILQAYVGSATPNSSSTLGAVVSSISSGTTLPSFVGGIPIDSSSSGDPAIALVLQNDTNTDGNTDLVLQILIGDVDITLGGIWGSTSNTSKLVFRVGVDKIPLISSIPLINQLPQPFSGLQYAFVEDDSGGFSSTELDSLNSQLPKDARPFVYQTNNQGSGADSLVVLVAGHHFIVINGTDIVLDHVFSDTTTQDPNSSGTSQAMVLSRAVHADDSGSGSDDATPTKGNLDVQLPFLSITAVTLQFKDMTLFVDIDATITLGPIAGTLIGFEIGLHLTKVTLNHLADMLTDGFISFGIHGLGISLDETPLELAGGFLHETGTTPQGLTYDEYAGGVAVGFEAWQLTAVGAYELITVSGGAQFKSIFIYAKLNGPLFTLAFATVSGVRAGFGYNSIVRQPAMTELPSFPFLDDSADEGAGNDPIALLQQFMGSPSGSSSGSSSATPWVSPKQDSYWVAVGMTLTAFGILSVTAVLMLGFHDSGVVISVFADGIAQMPPDVDSDDCLFYVEIYMLAELDTVEGYFTVQASLAPSSHVLVSSCRLTGGFALCNWFNPNAHSGDFVFTVGGYHPAYQPPAWYPVPDRLGISFTLGSMINVTGYVYFAITPKCVMGGGGLHMGLDVGPVSAWLDVALDVFVQFKPFHYTADLTVSVGCAITINVWFVHVRISASVGAALHIEGPNPFGGYANVDFYLFSFTIHFGGQPPPAPGIPLSEFFDMVKTPGPAPASNSSASTTDPNLIYNLKFSLTAGTNPQPTSTSTTGPGFSDQGANAVWVTKAGTFGCNIDCDFALTAAAILQSATDTTGDSVLPADGSNPPSFWSTPMHAASTDSFTSTLTITIYSINADGSTGAVASDFSGTMILKPVPTALWGPYTTAADPTQTKNPAALTDPSNPTMTLALGVALTPPPPAAYPALVQDFDATAAFLWPLGPYALPAQAATQAVLLAGAELYPTDTPAQRWAKVQADWKADGAAGAPILGGVVGTDGTPSPGLLTMVGSTLGWDVPVPGAAVAAKGQPPVWLLNGELPDMLIADLGDQYPVLPRYSAP